MKNIQRIIFCLGFLVFVNTTAFAQLGSDTADLSVHATVQATADVTAPKDVEFGTIYPDGEAQIIPNGTNSGVGVSNGNDPSYGKVTVTTPSILGLINAVSFSWPSSVTLTSDTGGNTLTYTPKVYGSSNDNDAANSTLVSNGTSLQLSTILDGGNNYYLYVGGSIGPLTDQPAGEYNGTLTITINYLGL